MNATIPAADLTTTHLGHTLRLDWHGSTYQGPLLGLRQTHLLPGRDVDLDDDWATVQVLIDTGHQLGPQWLDLAPGDPVHGVAGSAPEGDDGSALPPTPAGLAELVDGIEARVAYEPAELRAARHWRALKAAEAEVERLRHHLDSPSIVLAQDALAEAEERAEAAEAREVHHLANLDHARTERDALRAEVERLRRWKAEAIEVILGLQDLGKALGMRLGERITGTTATEAATRLVAERDHWKARFEQECDAHDEAPDA